MEGFPHDALKLFTNVFKGRENILVLPLHRPPLKPTTFLLSKHFQFREKSRDNFLENTGTKTRPAGKDR